MSWLGFTGESGAKQLLFSFVGLCFYLCFSV